MSARRLCARGLALLGAGLLLALGGCADEVSVEPLSGETLCFADYQQCVDPILHASINGSGGPVSCSASGCHDVAAGSGGGFKVFVNPANETELMANFFAAKAFANLAVPTDSKLLLEPLSGISAISGTHTGGDIFPGTGDACYAAILDWASRSVDDANAVACGACTAPTLADCGF